MAGLELGLSSAKKISEIAKITRSTTRKFIRIIVVLESKYSKEKGEIKVFKEKDWI